MGDNRLRRKLFGKNNEECMNINTEKRIDPSCNNLIGGRGFVGQTVKQIKILKAEVISLKARVQKLEKKRRR